MPKGNSGVDADVETDRVVHIMVGTFVGRGTDAINIFQELVTRRDVTFHCNASEFGCSINWDNGVFAVNILEDVQEVMKKWFDGIICNLFGGTIDINAKKGSYNVRMVVSKGRLPFLDNIWVVCEINIGLSSGGGSSAVAAIIIGIGRLEYVGISIVVRRR